MFNPPPGGQQFGPYPYTAVRADREKPERVRIESLDHLWQIVDSFTSDRYTYACFICDPHELHDEQADRDIGRYLYSKEWGISPYPGSYEEQPASWVDKTWIIGGELAKARKLKAEIDAKQTR